jgi:glycosyltransferase involved in cell wall biosynthesis
MPNLSFHQSEPYSSTAKVAMKGTREYMRVLILADKGSSASEGARNVSRAIVSGMEPRYDILSMPARAVVKRLAEIRRFNPQIVHSVHGPSPRTFAMMAVLRLVVPRAAFLMSLNQTGPRFNYIGPLLRELRFIRLLSQDPASERFFSQLGFSVYPLPNGVDTERFHPSSPVLPKELQGRLEPDRPCLMHVGHLKPNRGLDILAQLSGYRGWQVLIVGSPIAPAVPDVIMMLEDAGCIVLREFIEDLPELYSAINAYAFPVSDRLGAIDMPLSVLEAMACNCPVISTPFKALPRFLPPGDGLFYFNTIEEAKAALDQIMNCNGVMTRKKVAPMSWDNVLHQLEEVYTSCLHA